MLRRALLQNLSFATLLASRCAGQPDAMTARRVKAPQHDPARPHRCRFYCMDATRSLLPGQFKKAKAIMRASAIRDVRYNDLAWLSLIGRQAEPALIFAFPAAGATNSEIGIVDPEFHRIQQGLLSAIDGIESIASVTDLCSTIEQSLNILKTHNRAQAKYLTIASDFIDDNSRNRLTLDPPETKRGLSASGVRVILLVAQPKPEYLKKLNLSFAELFNTVSENWSQYFRKLGAAGFSTSLIDSIPTN